MVRMLADLLDLKHVPNTLYICTHCIYVCVKFFLQADHCAENLVHAIISTHNVESKKTAASGTADSLQDDAEWDELEN